MRTLGHMNRRRAFAIVTGLVGVLAIVSIASLVFLGFSITHWLMILKLALAASSLAAAVFLWTGHRFRVATAVLAWVLVGMWAAPAAIWYVMKLSL